MNRSAQKTRLQSIRGATVRLSICILGLGAWNSCAAPKKAPLAPKALHLPEALELRSGLHLGSILSGPQQGERKADQLVTCRIDVVLLRAAANEWLQPLASDLRLVADLNGQGPVQGGSRLAVGARWAHGADAESAWAAIQAGDWGDSLAMEPASALIPAGTTFTLHLAAPETIEDPDNFLGEWPDRGAVEKSLAVALSNRGGREEHALVAGFALGNLVRAEGDVEMTQVPSEGGRPGSDFLRKEWILPSRSPNLTGDPVLWLLPSPFELGPAKTVAVLVRTQTFDPESRDTEASEGVELALAQWIEAGSQKEMMEPESEEQAWLRQLMRAMQNATDAKVAYSNGNAGKAEALRRALVYHCNLVDLPLGLDLCLTADESMLVDWVTLVPDQEWGTAAAMGWALERAAWVQLARSMVKENLPDALGALVLRHGGEAGNYPSILEDAARSSIDFATFQKRLEQENRMFLEDASPAARVRAFDWLKRRGGAPPDWDPLDAKKKRRAVLSSWLAAFESGDDS